MAVIPETSASEVLYYWQQWADKDDFYGFYTHLADEMIIIIPPNRNLNPCKWVQEVINEKIIRC